MLHGDEPRRLSMRVAKIALQATEMKDPVFVVDPWELERDSGRTGRACVCSLVSRACSHSAKLLHQLEQ